MQNTELRQIIKKSLEIQKMLFNRLESETKKVDREWTAMQIAYQKGIYKRAMYVLNGCAVVDGVKMASEDELNRYFLHVGA
jgi:hypothetical protein